MLCPVPCPSSPASRQAQPASCISATRSARCSPGAARARPAGGSCCVLEDIDPTRCRPEFAAAILEDLAWLGLDWDDEVRVQSSTWPSIERARCVGSAWSAVSVLCTRADIQQSAAAPHTPDGAPLYPGTCRALSIDERKARIAGGEPFALRLDMRQALAAAALALTFEERRRHHRMPPRTVRRRRPRPQGRARQLPLVRHARRCAAGRHTGHTRGRPEAGDASASADSGADGLARTRLCPPPAANRRLRAPSGEARSRRHVAGTTRAGPFTRGGTGTRRSHDTIVVPSRQPPRRAARFRTSG